MSSHVNLRRESRLARDKQMSQRATHVIMEMADGPLSIQILLKHVCIFSF